MSPSAQTTSPHLRALSERMSPQRRPTSRYVVLAVLLGIALAYQFRTMEYRFPGWFGGQDRVEWPFILDAEDQPHFLVMFVRSQAHEAGLRDGEVLLAINGRPVTGRAVFADILAAAHAGDVLKVTVRPAALQGGAEQTVSVPLAPSTVTVSPVIVLLFAVMPPFCLALGFWVAAVRPRDTRAWLLLGLMLSLSAFFSSFPEFWGPKVRALGTAYYGFQQNIWVAWLFLLGVYFPEPFPGRLRWKWWSWLECTVLPLWVIIAAAYVAALVGELHSVAAVISINRFLGRAHSLAEILKDCLVAGFVASIASKYRLALSADAKRRLRVLYAGAIVSLAP